MAGPEIDVFGVTEQYRVPFLDGKRDILLELQTSFIMGTGTKAFAILSRGGGCRGCDMRKAHRQSRIYMYRPLCRNSQSQQPNVGSCDRFKTLSIGMDLHDQLFHLNERVATSQNSIFMFQIFMTALDICISSNTSRGSTIHHLKTANIK